MFFEEGKGFCFFRRIVIFLLFGAVIYFMMIRPQQQQVKRHQALIDALEVGDDVVTSSGIYGTITSVDDDTIDLEIADGIEVTMSRRAVLEVAVEEGDDGDGGSAEAGDAEDAEGEQAGTESGADSGSRDDDA